MGVAKICMNCSYAAPSRKADNEYLECRKYPPECSVQQAVRALWPVVRKTDWCALGYWKNEPKEEEVE